MTKKTAILFVAAILAAGFNQTAVAQDGGIVAVLDVKRVFDQNQQFSSKMDLIRKEAEGLKTQIQEQQAQIQNEARDVISQNLDTGARNQKETELEQRQAALRTKARQLEMDLLTREAKIYFETYQQMKQTVGSLSKKHGISLVMRFDSSPINPENRAEVIKGVNRNVVYHDHLDLTDLVIEGMGGTATAQRPTNQK